MTYKQMRNEIREIRARALKKIEENPNDIRAHQTLALFRELPENEDNFDALCHAEVTVELPKVNCFYIEDEPYYGLEKGDVYVRAETVKKVRLYQSVSTGEALEIIEALTAAADEIDL